MWLICREAATWGAVRFISFIGSTWLSVVLIDCFENLLGRNLFKKPSHILLFNKKLKFYLDLGIFLVTMWRLCSRCEWNLEGWLFAASIWKRCTVGWETIDRNRYRAFLRADSYLTEKAIACPSEKEKGAIWVGLNSLEIFLNFISWSGTVPCSETKLSILRIALWYWKIKSFPWIYASVNPD